MPYSRVQQYENLNNVRAKTLEIALFSTNPGASGTGTELTASGGYARQSITFAAPQVGGGGAYIANDTLINFGAASGDYSAAISYWAVYEVGGDLVTYGVFQELGVDSTRTIRTGDAFRIAIGTIVHRERD